MTEKAVRERTIGAALSLVEPIVAKDRKLTAVEQACFDKLLDAAELMLNETVPRELGEFVVYAKSAHGRRRQQLIRTQLRERK
jgi:hypothetical protein